MLKKNKIQIISSGGTYKKIKKFKFDCIEVSNFTKSPEILNGREKLYIQKFMWNFNKRNSFKHKKELKINNFENIDLVIVNFYPLKKQLKIQNHEK